MSPHPWLMLLRALSVGAAGCSNDDVSGPDPDPDGDVASITLTEGPLSFGAVGSSRTVAAVVRDAAGDPLPGAVVEWRTDGTGVASVVAGEASSLEATVSSIGNGSDVIRASAGTVEATVTVVVDQVPVSLSLTVPGEEFTRVGEIMRITASGADSNGVALASPAAISFASSDPRAVHVDSEGLVTANGIGSAVLTAVAGSIEASATVSVVITGPHGPAVLGEPMPCTGGLAGPFPCDRVDLVSYLPLAALGVDDDLNVNDLWGWTDGMSGRRYALVGRDDGVSFIDVTDPLRPLAVGWLPASVPSVIWRDLKVYADHMYVVADVAPAHGVQVFDLTRLRGVEKFTEFTEDARYGDVSAAHNIAINTETGFAYSVGSGFGGQTCGGGLHMIDLANPEAPVFAGCFADPATGLGLTGYTHDVQCVVYHGPDADYAGREICLGSNETAISIADVTDKSSPIAVANASYPGAAYVHQGWLTEDHRYFIQNDEHDERDFATTRMLIWDIVDLDDPVLAHVHPGPTRAIDHNVYILGTTAYQSNYTYGIRIVDLGDPLNPVEAGWFDTHPEDDDLGFEGSWSNYPFFDDGRVIVTSRKEGLFILEPHP
jgi:choice-of-anchor B domain-containing protein